MIRLSDVSKTYNSRGEQVRALRNISLHIEKGEFVSITGKSGSGKSTLLHCMGLIDSIDSGKIYIDNTDVAALDNRSLASFRNRMIGFVFQSSLLEPSYTVYDNLCVPMYIARASRKEINIKVQENSELVGLSDKLKRKACELSGGERQRVGIARALMCDPSVILADEPCGNLDSVNSEAITRLFRRLSQQGKTVVLITHDEEQAAVADRRLYIKDGALEQ